MIGCPRKHGAPETCPLFLILLGSIVSPILLLRPHRPLSRSTRLAAGRTEGEAFCKRAHAPARSPTLTPLIPKEAFRAALLLKGQQHVELESDLDFCTPQYYSKRVRNCNRLVGTHYMEIIWVKSGCRGLLVVRFCQNRKGELKRSSDWV